MALKAHFDGSGTHGDPILTVGGYVASEEVCIEIERQWLAATGGRIFHLTDYGTPSCKLGSADWKPSEGLGFLKRLAGIINRPDVKIVSSSLEASEYSKFLEKTNYEDIWGPAYSGLAMGSVLSVGRALRNDKIEKEKLAYIFEKGDREYEVVQLMREHERTEKYRDLRSHHFLPKSTALLQPADLIVGVVQRVLIDAFRAIKCLDNGLEYCALHTFHRYFSTDGVTAAVLPTEDPLWLLQIINKSGFRAIDGVHKVFEAKNPIVLQRIRKGRSRQNKSRLNDP